MSIPVTIMEGFDIRGARFVHYILANARLEQLAAGFRWIEGRVRMGDANCRVFQDLPHNRTIRWIKNPSVSIDHEPSGYAKGQTRDRQGGLISCIGGPHALYAIFLNRRGARWP
jgi:gluconolactonase